MSSAGIPFFEASELAGARDVLHEKLMLHPLDGIFPDEVHEGSYIDVDVKVHTPYASDPTDRGEPSPYGDPHDFRTVRAEPVQLRNARPLSNKEVSFFRRYGEIRQTAGITESLESRRGRHLTDITRETMMPPEERRHVMQCEALQGAVNLRIGGVSQSYSYGLNDLTGAIGTPDWSNPAATVVQDLYTAFDEFENNSTSPANVYPDTVIFNKRLFAHFLTKNTEFTGYVKENPGLAKAFMGFLQADGDLAGMVAPNMPFRMFDMTWIPVTGSYTDSDGNSSARWPLNRLGLLSLNAGDGQRVLEWSSTRDEYNPNGTPEFRTWSMMDPISHKVEYSMNGVPMIYIRERVQYCDIAP